MKIKNYKHFDFSPKMRIKFVSLSNNSYISKLILKYL